MARARLDRAASLLRAYGVDGEVLASERPGHARELAEAALARGVSLVAAWGGDGTVNEVASVLAFRDAALGIVPSGSGNGLARELAIPFDVDAAFDVFLRGQERIIDCGAIDGRYFFNIAGFGLDARVAHQFAENGLVRRGFRRYLEITARELIGFEPDDHTIVADATTVRLKTMIVAIANGRQYGNGAVIAPDARLDDGKLDVVIVADRHPAIALLEVPLVFLGLVGRLHGVTMMAAEAVEVTSAHTVLYHIDGEPYVGAASVKARVHPHALRVRVPA